MVKESSGEISPKEVEKGKNVNCNIKMQKNSEVKMYDNYKVKDKDGYAILIFIPWSH